MLIKFTGGGKGSGKQVAEYLVDPLRQGRGHAPPEVVRGDMNRTRELIDSIDRQWSYTHGVLSFALEDAPNEAQQQEAMDAFEAVSFAGLDQEQYDITWVRHQHTEGGRVELHFVVPRMELVSGKALNIAPPGWASTYAPLRDALNWSHGWARPDDPERARTLQGPSERLGEGLRGREGREALHGFLSALVASEQVIDRASMVQALGEAGLEVPRQGRDYVTVCDPDSGERWRLKGRIYEKDWTYDAELDRAVAREVGGSDSRDRGVDRDRAEAAIVALKERMQRRAAFHAERYPRDDRSDGPELETSEAVREVLVGRADPDVVGDRGLIGLALDGASDGGDRVVSDVRVRGADLSVATGGDGSSGLRGPRNTRVSALRSSARGGVGDGSVDGLRAQLAVAVRDLGGKFKERTGRFRSNVRSVAGFVLECTRSLGSDRGEAARDRRDAEEVARCFERAEQGNRGLGEAGQQVARRTAQIERAYQQRQEQSRGWGISR